ncbi:MAG: carboxypeptidase-like regulatory domain-containing protein [Candidatus Aenigmarchaeota archaeon]|nr:carboxypeptidase-like regulatory domain-containing protein [Candidatus Aenigmarchaeota archaeon]
MNKKILFVFALSSLVGIYYLNTTNSASNSITINLKPTKVWWNDSVLAYGKLLDSDGLPIQGAAVSVKIDNQLKCSSETNSSGDYNCSFNAPNELGSYTVTSEAEGAVATATLEVKASYGEKPIGTIDRIVYEVPLLIQEMSGRIRRVFARIMVWKA